MSNNIYKKFKKTGTEEYFEMVPYSADTAMSATTAQNAEAIGKVEKYSGVYGGKQRDGLLFKHSTVSVLTKPSGNPNEGVIELNTKGNFTVEARGKNLNLESAQGIQIKPLTNIGLDSSRRILNGSGNEVNIEARFDDYQDFVKGEKPEYSGKTGNDEAYAELKIKSRNLDLRCHDHGGIALQIAGKDGHGNENKIKFESDRTSPIGSTGVYNGEGGKGLEFGTFNNNHASLYCGDYRFKGDAQVYGVTRGDLTQTGTKIDYPTQGDDFKDIVDSGNTATWNEIIDAAKKCKTLDETISAAIVSAQLSGSDIDTSVFVTTSEVNDVVNAALSSVSFTNYYTKQEVDDAISGGTAYVKSVVFEKEGKGNVEVSAEGKLKVKENPEDPDEAASLDLVSDGKAAIKAGLEFEIGAKDIVIPIEVSKKNKYSCGGYEVESGATNGITNLETFKALLPKVTLRIEKQNSTIPEIKSEFPVGDISVSIYDLIKLVSKVADLERRVALLEGQNPEQEGE